MNYESLSSPETQTLYYWCPHVSTYVCLIISWCWTSLPDWLSRLQIVEQMESWRNFDFWSYRFFNKIWCHAEEIAGNVSGSLKVQSLSTFPSLPCTSSYIRNIRLWQQFSTMLTFVVRWTLTKDVGRGWNKQKWRQTSHLVYNWRLASTSA